MMKYFAVLCIALLLSGCASYRVKPLRKLTKETAQYTYEKNNVQICASRLHTTEFQEYVCGQSFQTDSVLVPLLVTIYNKSARSLIWRADDVKLLQLSAVEAVPRLGLGSGSAIENAIGSCFSMMAGGSIIFSLCFVVKDLAYVLAALGFSTVVFAVPVAILTAVHTSDFNAMLFEALKEKILSEIEIVPGAAESKLIVAYKKDLQRPFIMAVRAVDSGEKVEFTVALPPLAVTQ